jgi:hypothetical protein
MAALTVGGCQFEWDDDLEGWYCLFCGREEPEEEG